MFILYYMRCRRIKMLYEYVMYLPNVYEFKWFKTLKN